MDTLTGPGHDPWTVAVFTAADPLTAAGCGVLIDRDRVLTCWHVVAGQEAVTVAFPKADVARSVRIPVREIRSHADDDVAVLTLAEPAPPEAMPAPLRSPRPAALVGDQWWAFGFPRESELGSDSSGQVGTVLSYGHVRLDTRSRYAVKSGFSGTGLWSRNYNAVVGLVVRSEPGGAHPGDAQALTLHRVARSLPGEKLEELTAWSIAVAGDAALEAWGWSLSGDIEAVRHWRPRARGVSVDTEGGYRFRGRTAALTEIVGWLCRSRPDHRVLVVTGSPGVGKSAVLGRVVTTADKGVRAALPATDRNVRAPIGSIACAVHVKGKTALDVAVEIARAASVRLPRTVDELVPALRDRLLQERGTGRFNLVVDALDEAASPRQARLIVSALLLPIARTCSRLGAQVVVGSRRGDDGGDLLRDFGSGARLIDLDSQEYFAEEDLREYAHATLALTGDERPGNPYAEVAVATPVAARIAALADRNFLIAGLIARSHGMYDTTAVDPATLAFTATVDEALATYLKRLPPVQGVPATTLLTVLAYAQAPGISAELWRVALDAFEVTTGYEALVGFAGSSAANFLVESSNDMGAPRYRLFHQALNDALVRQREAEGRRDGDERMLAHHLIQHGKSLGWSRADPYLLRTLPAYAGRAGLIDVLLTDDDFLLHADLPRLTQLAGYAGTEAGRARARLLRLTSQAIDAGPAERAAQFGLTAELEQLGDTFTSWRGVPYRARWAGVPSRAERSVLEGHPGAVRAVCAVPVGGQVHVATVGDFPYVRIWHPASGRSWPVPVRSSGDAADPVTDHFLAVCAVPVEGRTLVAAAGPGGRIHLVDPAGHRPAGRLPGPVSQIRTLCTLVVGDHRFLVSGSDDGVIRMWDLADGRTRTLAGHQGTVRSVRVIVNRGRRLLLSAGDDHRARVWDPATGNLLRVIGPHVSRVSSACPVVIAGRQHVVTASYRDATVWDPRTGMENGYLSGHTAAIRDLTAVAMAGHDVLVTGSADHDVRVWDPGNGVCRRVLSGHTDSVNAVCAVTIERRAHLVTASSDRTVRLWDLTVDTGNASRAARVSAACTVRVHPRTMVATVDGNEGTIRLRDVETGAEGGVMEASVGPVTAMCAVPAGHRDLVVVAGDYGVLQVWDPFSRTLLAKDMRPSGRLRALAPIRSGTGEDLLAAVKHRNRRAILQFCRPDTLRTAGRRARSWFAHPDQEAHLRSVTVVRQIATPEATVLVTAGEDGQVMLWHPTGRATARLTGHRRPIRALTALPVNGRTVLATGGDDQAIRLWDLYADRPGQAVLTGHTDGINALCPVSVADRTLLASGSRDRTVRLWDPATGTPVLTIPVHYPVLACEEVAGLLFVGLTAGALALDLNAQSNDVALLRAD